MFFHANTIKKCQTMTYMPNTTFSCQTTKAKFQEFGLKNANLATLVAIALSIIKCQQEHNF